MDIEKIELAFSTEFGSRPFHLFKIESFNLNNLKDSSIIIFIQSIYSVFININFMS